MISVQRVFDSFGVAAELFGPLEKKIEYYEERGYQYLQAWTTDAPFVPDRVQMPSGRILDLKSIDSAEPLDLECVTASSYYDLIRELPLEDRNHYLSFDSTQDEANCFGKYTAHECLI